METDRSESDSIKSETSLALFSVLSMNIDLVLADL